MASPIDIEFSLGRSRGFGGILSKQPIARLARHKALDIYQMLELRYGQADPKMHRYGELVRSLLADQLAWLEVPSHRRKITEQNGRDALAIAAAAADALARGRRNGMNQSGERTSGLP
jgi:hypothetical protein